MFRRTPLPFAFFACTVAIASAHVGSARAQSKTASLVLDSRAMPDQAYDPYVRVAPSTDCDGVTSVERRFVDDLKTKKMDDVLSLYTPGAVFIQPDGTEVIGLDALRRLYLTIFATYDSDLSLEDSEIRPVSSGSSLCVHSGHYDENLRTRKDGTTAHIHGMYSFTYKRTKDGRWLITRMRWVNGT
jgi:ketosteroid isomerase-like protein